MWEAPLRGGHESLRAAAAARTWAYRATRRSAAAPPGPLGGGCEPLRDPHGRLQKQHEEGRVRRAPLGDGREPRCRAEDGSGRSADEGVGGVRCAATAVHDVRLRLQRGRGQRVTHRSAAADPSPSRTRLRQPRGRGKRVTRCLGVGRELLSSWLKTQSV